MLGYYQLLKESISLGRWKHHIGIPSQQDESRERLAQLDMDKKAQLA